MIVMKTKTYLGDGVYLEFDSGSMILTTSNGVEVTNEIFIDDEVFHNFIHAIEKQLRCKITIISDDAQEVADENG